MLHGTLTNQAATVAFVHGDTDTTRATTGRNELHIEIPQLILWSRPM